MNEKLQLEEGKTYVLRNGKIPRRGDGYYCVLRRSDDPRFPWAYGGYTYTESGRYYLNEPDSRDIVAEYVPPAEEKPEAPADAKTLRDEFAMAAMNALMLKATFDQSLGHIPMVASASYKMADAMLEARKGKAQS